jgi:GntR family transcriptional regulator
VHQHSVGAVKFWNKYQDSGNQPIWKHQHLRECIAAAIRDEFWEPGEKLPAEAELARITPFSLGTVQKAFRDLVAQGLVERRQGAGTFVVQRPKAVDTPWHYRFSGDKRGEFLPIFPRIDRVSRRVGDGPWRHYLHHADGKLVQIDRIINIGHEFDLFSQFFVDARTYEAACAGGRKLEGVDFRRELGLAITGIAYELRAGEFPAAICTKIGVKKKTCGTILDIRATASNPRQRYFQRAFVPPSARWLHVAEFDPNTIGRIGLAPGAENGGEIG